MTAGMDCYAEVLAAGTCDAGQLSILLSHLPSCLSSVECRVWGFFVLEVVGVAQNSFNNFAYF